jgi:hypothetical protein
MFSKFFTRVGSRSNLLHAEDERDGRALDRRGMLRLGGMAAAGVAGATVVTAVNAAPASANNGDSLKLGTKGAPNTETSATGLFCNSGATVVSDVYGFGVIDHGTGGFNWSPAIGGVAHKINLGAGVEGNGFNGANGVVGFSDTGMGVQVGSSSGTGVYGVCTEGPGVFGSSDSDVGVYGRTGSGSRLRTLRCGVCRVVPVRRCARPESRCRRQRVSVWERRRARGARPSDVHAQWSPDDSGEVEHCPDPRSCRAASPRTAPCSPRCKPTRGRSP